MLIGGVEVGLDDLRHVYWIGGAPGAGKSTIARRLADRHGMYLYATDDVMSDHLSRTTPEESPYLSRFAAMDMDERWLNRSPLTMLETFHWFRGECFALIVEDLVRLREGGIPVVAEGFRLLPQLVQPLLAEPREGDRRSKPPERQPVQAVWLLPTPGFRAAALESRGSTWTIAGRTSAPERALANLVERDRMFTERLAEETGRLSLPAIHLEVGGLSEDELDREVSRIFGL